MRENFKHLFFGLCVVSAISLAFHPFFHHDHDTFSSENTEIECQLCESFDEVVVDRNEIVDKPDYRQPSGSSKDQGAFYSYSLHSLARAPPA